MAEATSNVEFAHRIHEAGHSGGGPHSHRAEWLEILEAVALAAVAVLTAWSGYQAAKWDAESAESYAHAAATTVQGQEQQTLAGQDHLYDVITFGSWIEAFHRGDQVLAQAFEKRFRPEYAIAYAAWLKTDPFHNPKALPGPSFMPEYKTCGSREPVSSPERPGSSSNGAWPRGRRATNTFESPFFSQRCSC